MIEFLDGTINIFENRFGLFWFPCNGLMGKTNWASRNSLGRYFGIPQDANMFEYPFKEMGGRTQFLLRKKSIFSEDAIKEKKTCFFFCAKNGCSEGTTEDKISLQSFSKMGLLTERKLSFFFPRSVPGRAQAPLRPSTPLGKKKLTFFVVQSPIF